MLHESLDLAASHGASLCNTDLNRLDLKGCMLVEARAFNQKANLWSNYASKAACPVSSHIKHTSKLTARADKQKQDANYYLTFGFIEGRTYNIRSPHHW
jgi:hypothetical protein